MEKPAGSGKRFLIVGLGAVGAALILPACGASEASALPSSTELAADSGAVGNGGMGSEGTGGSGNGTGGVHGTIANNPSSGCAVGQRRGHAGSAGEIGMVLVGLMAGNRRRRPRSD